MVRNLTAQAEAIWPQEQLLFQRYGRPTRILDVGCGTGEISSRLATLFGDAHVTGVDLLEPHLELARARYGQLADRLVFRQADAFELPFPDGSFDLVVCRHMLQAVPHPERVIAELVRVTAHGGYLHLLVEDYDMIHAGRARIDIGSFWHQGPRAFGKATGTDLYIGRNAFSHLRALAVDELMIDYVIVDTQRVPRATFAAIFEAWRDGYAEPIAEQMGLPAAEVRDYFDATLECIRTEFAVWFVPILSARVR